jgi:hypothetical protein
MRNFLPACCLLFLLRVNSVAAQTSDETVIRTLENAERKAILNGDTARLSKLMSSKIIVQNPENKIVTYREIMDRIRTGKISYASFERNIEKVSVFGGTVVVMGNEVITMGTTLNPGKKILRRFTNIWMKEKGTWKLTARQATIISGNE